MVIEESGKLYHIDEETGLVTEASLADEDTAAIADEFRVGDRVEVLGHAGEVISIIPSYYGAAFGIKFDDGNVDEFVESQLKHSSVEKKTYETPVLEVYGRYDEYVELPTYTEDELEIKEAEARWLRHQAQSLQSAYSEGGLDNDPKLEEIVLTTTSDLSDIEDVKNNANLESNQRYLSSFNKYRLADTIDGGAVMGGSDDADWLGGVTEDIEVPQTLDTDLATRATEVVTALTKEQLEDDEFMRVAGAYQYQYLQMTDAQQKTFDAYLAAARATRIKELPTETKTASTYDLDDATDLYL